MTLQSVGNALSLQQIMQMLQQQSLAAPDPEAAAAGQAGTPDPAGQNVPTDQASPEDPAAAGAQVTPAKAPLDPATIKTLLQIQELQNRASDDVLLFGDTAKGSGTGDPLLDALGTNGVNGGGDPLLAATSGEGGATPDPLSQYIDQLTAPQDQTGGQGSAQGDTQGGAGAADGDLQTAAQSAAQNLGLASLDPAQLQSILASMTGSAASGDSIATLTQSIMSLLGSDSGGSGDVAAADDGPAPVSAAEG